MSAPTAPAEVRTFTIPAVHEDEFVKRVAKANTYLAKNGIDGLFTFDREVILVPSAQDADVLTERIVFTATSAPTFALGDYVFVASLVGEEAGMVVHTAPGQSLVGWDRPAGDDTSCAHCGVDRARKNLYVVRNTVTAEVVQVGSTCIQAFLGVEPKGLGMLEFLDALEATVAAWGEGTSTLPEVFTVDRVLAVSAAITEMGRKYVSVAKASEWERPSTGSLVKGHLIYGAPRRANYRGPQAEMDYQRDLAAYEAIQATAAAIQADEATLATIKAAAATLGQDSDYGVNMGIIVAGESVRTRNVGILASLLAVYARNLAQAAEAQASAENAVTGYLGEVKVRVKAISLTLTRVRYIDGNYGTSTLLAGVAANGMAVEWFATGHHAYNEGDTIVLDATVKAHKAAGSDRYTKADTTVLTRGKIAA